MLSSYLDDLTVVLGLTGLLAGEALTGLYLLAGLALTGEAVALTGDLYTVDLTGLAAVLVALSGE